VHFYRQSTDGFVALLKINGKIVVTEIREMRLAAYFTQNNINELLYMKSGLSNTPMKVMELPN